MTPRIFQAFANDKDAYLPKIRRESESIYKTLRNHDDKAFIRLFQKENISLDAIFDYFYHYKNEIFIFHYGGHASGTHLQLETMTGHKQMADARGLAQLMGRQKELRLVFLNGCATQRQVALLHDAGVRAVIATSVPIEDQSATEFAEHFYKSLAKQFTIKEAFSNARGFIIAKYGTTRQIKEYRYRDLNWKKMRKTIKTEVAWGLYIHEDHEKVLDWKLPTSIYLKPSDSLAPPTGEIDPINFKLVELLLNEAVLYSNSNDLKKWKKELDRKKLENYPTVQRDVHDIFPTPIGEHLECLFQDRKHYKERFKQLVAIYQITIEFLCFTMLSELWDAKFKNPKIVISEDYLAQFRVFVDLSAGSCQSFPYVKLIETVSRIFDENKIEYFVEELKTLEKSFRDEDDFYYALLFMENMKKIVIKDNVKETEIEDNCIQAQEHLGIILKKLMALFVKYKLTTIKQIETVKHKHKAPKYLHNRIMLHQLSVKKMPLFKEWKSYTDSNSVILLKNADDVSEYMSLSPFVIDKATLFPDWEKSQLYFYTYQNSVDKNYNYKFSGKEENEPLILSVKEHPNIYSQIKDQFAEFREKILNLELKKESIIGEHHGRI
jgi:hypothetical protein